MGCHGVARWMPFRLCGVMMECVASKDQKSPVTPLCNAFRVLDWLLEQVPPLQSVRESLLTATILFLLIYKGEEPSSHVDQEHGSCCGHHIISRASWCLFCCRQRVCYLGRLGISGPRRVAVDGVGWGGRGGRSTRAGGGVLRGGRWPATRRRTTAGPFSCWCWRGRPASMRGSVWPCAT